MTNEIKDKSQNLDGRKIISWTIILSPILLFISMLSMGGGHGTYFFGKLFHPVSMIIAGYNSKITDLALWIAIFQYPFYSTIIYLSRKHKWKIIALVIVIIHIILWILAMNIANEF